MRIVVSLTSEKVCGIMSPFLAKPSLVMAIPNPPSASSRTPSSALLPRSALEAKKKREGCRQYAAFFIDLDAVSNDPRDAVDKKMIFIGTLGSFLSEPALNRLCAIVYIKVARYFGSPTHVSRSVSCLSRDCDTTDSECVSVNVCNVFSRFFVIQH